MNERKRMIILDGHAYLHRAYHALPPLKTAAGEPVGALFGFLKAILGILRKEAPEYFAVCFDSPGPTFRHERFRAYKAQRPPTEPDLKVQLQRSRELVRSLGIPAVELQGWEADDLIATLCARARGKDLEVLVISGDKDVLQLVEAGVRVLRETKDAPYDDARVQEKFGVGPGKLGDYLALVGDSADNIPGAPGIGPKGAVKLLNLFGDLDSLLKAAQDGNKDLSAKLAASLRENAAQVRLGRELVALDADAPVKLELSDCRVRGPQATPELGALLDSLEFHRVKAELGFPESSPAAAKPSAQAQVPQTREVLPGEFLKAAAGAERVGLQAHAEEQDLVGGGFSLSMGLEDGRCCLIRQEEFGRHRAALSGLLAGPVRKCSYDSKSTLRILSDAGFPVGGPIFDARVAAWCLGAGRERLDEEALFTRYLGAAPAQGDSAASSVLMPALSRRLDAELESAGLRKVYEELELPLIPILVSMEKEGIALDVEYLRELRAEFAGVLETLKREVDALAGAEVNLNSPKQVAELLFGRLGLMPVKKTGSGAASTDEETLHALAAQHPIPAKILDHRETAKLQSTYVEGLLARVSPSTRRVHTHFDQTGTATGRLSSLDPNLQNIPVRTALGQKIRRAFVAEKGNVLLSADYSQIELRVLAHLSGDEALREAFRLGQDVHLRTAAEVFGVAEDAVTPELRRRAKAVNFGIIYGQTSFGLAKELDIPRAEAQEIIDRYFLRYKGVQEWIRRTLEAARREGVVRTIFGRIRRADGLDARNFNERAFAERAVVNSPIQGTAADIIKAAMISVSSGIGEHAGGKARMLLQVHDELLFELPKPALKEFSSWARSAMESAVRLEIPVVVDLKQGPDWKGMERMP
ncbi:MAG: DNA polymerase I [Elusimicrobiota bacterium]|jgi:DNA polymerase-1